MNALHIDKPPGKEHKWLRFSTIRDVNVTSRLVRVSSVSMEKQ
jgi:hypothetical protein